MRKKKRLFYDSRKSISTRKILPCKIIFFIVFIIIIFSFFFGLIFTDFADVKFSLIVLSKLIHTNLLVGNI